MNSTLFSPVRTRFAPALLGFSCFAFSSLAEETPESARAADVHGGAVVLLGPDDASLASGLARTGRYVVNAFVTEEESVAPIRTALQRQNLYGVATVEPLEDSSKLPYTENLVNFVVVDEASVPLAEIFRVLAPLGAILVRDADAVTEEGLASAGFHQVRATESEAGDAWLLARKPWPEAMGRWTHSRHDANGNAVSPDTAVGEPKRIRWMAAHSGSEVEGMVSDGGRNFYGQVLARDGFNGFRLWHRDLTQPEEKMDPTAFRMNPLRHDSARPVATEKFLFAVAFPNRNLVALDAVTGEIAHAFPEIASPTELVHHRGVVVATTDKAVYAFSQLSGEMVWKSDSSAPRAMVAGGDQVSYIQGEPRRGEKPEAVTVDLYSGEVLWKNDSHSWLGKVQRVVRYGDQLSYEASTFTDFDTDTGIHIVDAQTGRLQWEKLYAPGMNHKRQARSLFIGDDLWIQQGGKVDYPDRDTKVQFQPVEATSLDPETGETRRSLPAGFGHCAPPVATVNMMFSGVVEITDLESGELLVNAITKSNCSNENGFIPANGLVYSTPKHCTCWPMLRGYIAMAPEHPLAAKDEYPPAKPAEEIEFSLVKGPASADPAAPAPAAGDWPVYRHDEWRSGSATVPGPEKIRLLWEAEIAPQGHPLPETSVLRYDWEENPFVKGLLSAPTIAGGLAYVTRPDAHEVVALDADTGDVAWRFTARGRVDTPPTIHRGLCLFGDHAGYVHALRADTGEVVWRLRAAPLEERMGAYGQLESAWPVPGSVLVMDDIAYFTAGRQQLSDGGVFLFSVDPTTGDRHWVRKLNEIPQKGYEGDSGDSFGFYKNSGLEFDPVDLLHREGDRLALSRWLVSLDGNDVAVDTWDAFARLDTGNGSVFAPRGTWTYGFRQIHRFGNEAFKRSLCVYRDNTVVGALDSTTALYRRDFDLENGEEFDRKWITGWEAAGRGRKGERPYRSDRIAEKAKWTVNPWAEGDSPEELLAFTTVEGSAQHENKLAAMVLDSAERLYVVHRDGTLKVVDTRDGSEISSHPVAEPIWDGLALANGRLYLSTADGRLLCLGGDNAVAFGASRHFSTFPIF
ncbi:MAG: PQQ-binding-like beta-propeller repeat protein [Verrucomicrobiales bacterium]